MSRAIGMVELKTVSTGIKAADTIVKTAQVQLIQSQCVCPGKYIILFTGEISAVQASIAAVEKNYESGLIDKFLLGNPHESILKALTCTTEIEDVEALGVIETFTGASTIVAADYAAKHAEVDLIEIHVARGMAGKSYLLLTGSVAAVTQSVEGACKHIENDGTLLDYAIIPRPSRDFIKTLL